MTTLREELGQRIRELRQAKGLSQPKLAELAKMDYKYLGGVERGERNITIDNVERILSALRVQPYELWSLRKTSPLPADKADLAVLLADARRLDKESRRQLGALARHFIKLSKK
jgi:transcriptional regulator with XRE-family HTH domain